MNVERADTFVASMGLEAYRVGGSVRDELLGRPVKDADYVVFGADLRTLNRSLRVALATGRGLNPSVKPLSLRDGRQAGWRVSARGLSVLELVLPRTERSTGPGHRDFEIVLDPGLSLEEDAQRRDFTFNALYKRMYGYQTVTDPTGRGLYDLQHRIIQTTHTDSFRDDPLRTLRALRFVSTLGYDLSAFTRAEMKVHAKHVTGLSAKGYASGTVYEELCKILMGDDAVKALRLARDTGVLGTLFPGLKPMLGFAQGSRYHDLTTDEHTFKALETAIKVEAPLRVRLALLFHDSGKPETAWTGKDGRVHYYARKTTDMIDPYSGNFNLDHEEQSEWIWNEAAEWMGVPAKIRREVATLIREHMVPISMRNVGVRARRMRVKLGDELMRDLLMHRMCDLTGKGTGKQNMDALTTIGTLEAERAKAEAFNVPATVRDLKVNGQDCMASGLEGPSIGTALAALLDEVVCDPSDLKMSRDWQLSRL